MLRSSSPSSLADRCAAPEIGPFPTISTHITVHTVEGTRAISWLHDRWPALYARDPQATPFGSAGWLAGWASQLPAGCTLLLLVAEGADQEVLGALALAREFGGPIRPLGHPYNEYTTVVGPGAHDPLVASALGQALDRLAQETVVELSNVPDCSALGTAMLSLPDWQTTTTATAVVPLPLNTAVLPKSARKQHRQRERKLTGYQVTYRRTRSFTELLGALAALEAMHAARNATADRTSPGPSPHWPSILRHGVDAFITEVQLDGTPMASQLCLRRGNRCFSVLPTMNPDLSHLSPGHILLVRMIADLADCGMTALDLGPTRDDPGQIGYKAQYAPAWDCNLTSVSGARPLRPGRSLTVSPELDPGRPADDHGADSIAPTAEAQTVSRSRPTR